MGSNILQFGRKTVFNSRRLHFRLLSTLFSDVQTKFNRNYLSSQSKEFRVLFLFFALFCFVYIYIERDSYTKVQLLPWSRIFYFYFLIFWLTQLFKSFQVGYLVTPLLLILTLPLNWTLDSGDHQHGVLLWYSGYSGTEAGIPAEGMAVVVTQADPKRFLIHIQHKIA